MDAEQAKMMADLGLARREAVSDLNVTAHGAVLRDDEDERKAVLQEVRDRRDAQVSRQTAGNQHLINRLAAWGSE